MEIKFKPWMVPNFLISESPPGLRQDGPKFTTGWALRDIDADELSKQCDLFRAEIFRKAGKDDPKPKP